MNDKKYQYMREIAESFINLDHQLDAYLKGSADILGVELPDVPVAVIYGILREGAVVHKYHELIRTYEAAKREADGT